MAALTLAGAEPGALAEPPLCVHIIDELPPDGAERLIADILGSGRPERFRYAVLCLVAGGQLAEEIAAAGIPVTILNCRRGIDLGTLPVLYRWLKWHRPQVVHTHLFAADSYGRAAALLAGVPVIVSTRHNTIAWAGSARRAIARLLSLATSRTIACGREVGKAMVLREGIPRSKMVVISNGINLRRLESARGGNLRKQLGIGPGQRLIGLIGRLHAQKGHNDLLEALAMLPRTGGWLCVLAGSGDLEDEIRSTIHRLKLQDSVRLIGQRKDVPDVLAALDILVMPSRWEGLPMALLEGMAFSLPVVATRVGSVPEVIEDNCNGILVDPANPEDLMLALQRVLADAVLAARLGAAARQTIEQRFNAERTGVSYENLYQELLEARAARRRPFSLASRRQGAPGRSA